ncbi:MAG: hypothetical protein SX243_25320 [Acidobacteriota bacterium]|nr:hypothetical protein [Acidobacteriota bacterium]
MSEVFASSNSRQLLLGALLAIAMVVATVPATATTLDVTGGAAIDGSFGMAINFTPASTTRAYVEDASPSGETHYVFRYRFDPNEIIMDDNKRYKQFTAFRETPSQYRCINVTYRKNGTDNFFRIKSHMNPASAEWQRTAWITLPEGPSVLEVDWTAASGPGAADGEMRVWLDGTLIETVPNLDNDECAIDFVRWGAVGGVDPNTDGAQNFDLFESFR